MDEAAKENITQDASRLDHFDLDTASRALTPEPADEAEKSPAAQRLREFEDAEFGPDVVRINGNIERGYGSPFKEMPEAKRRKHAALEKLVVTEQKLDDAHTALMQADADHDAAEAEVTAADDDNAGA